MIDFRGSSMFRLAKACLHSVPIGLVLMSLFVAGPIRADDVTLNDIDYFDEVVAYKDPPAVGNQVFMGSLAQDFTVNSPISVTDLGVFDSGQNGIAGTLMVAIFSSNGTKVTPTLTFSGTAGTLVDGTGDRFLSLLGNVPLAPGNYSLTTVGWGPGDPNGNQTCNGRSACGGGGASIAAPTLNTYTDGVRFTGIGFDANGTFGYLPPEDDTNGVPFPANTLNAGTFVFPEPSTAILLAVGLLLLVLGPRHHRQRT